MLLWLKGRGRGRGKNDEASSNCRKGVWAGFAWEQLLLTTRHIYFSCKKSGIKLPLSLSKELSLDDRNKKLT